MSKNSAEWELIVAMFFIIAEFSFGYLCVCRKRNYQNEIYDLLQLILLFVDRQSILSLNFRNGK